MNIPNHFRLTLAAVLLLATGTACTDDLATDTHADGDLAGQPVHIGATALDITGTVQTRSTETDFPTEGTTLTVYMLDADNNLLQQANYTFQNIDGYYTAVADADNEPLRWPSSTGTYRFTAISPAVFAKDCEDGLSLPVSLPAEWTEDDLATYEELRVTSVAKEITPTTDRITLPLHHPLAKVQIYTSDPGPVYLTDGPATGTISLNNNASAPTTAVMQLCQRDEALGSLLPYQGFILPTTATSLAYITGKQAYTLTIDGGLKAGQTVTTTTTN